MNGRYGDALQAHDDNVTLSGGPMRDCCELADADAAKLRLVAHLTPSELERVLKLASDVDALCEYVGRHNAFKLRQRHDGLLELCLLDSSRIRTVERKLGPEGHPGIVFSEAALWVKEHGAK